MESTYLLVSFESEFSQLWHGIALEATRIFQECLDAQIVRTEYGRFAKFRGRSIRKHFDPVPPIHLVDRTEADVGIVVFYTGSAISRFAFLDEAQWRPMAKRWLAIVIEIWPSHVEEYRREIDDVLSAFERIVVTTPSGARALQRAVSCPVISALCSVDALAVQPLPFAERGIGIVNPGRRDAHQHDVLMEAARRARMPYLFDTFGPGRVPSIADHRRAYYERIGFSRLMVTNRAKFDDPEATGTKEYGLRIMEALVGGALPVGELLDAAPHADALPDWIHAHPLPLGESSSVDAIVELLRDETAIGQAVLEGPLAVLNGHDWSHRLLALLGVDRASAPAPLRERFDRLDARAADHRAAVG
jgi:hypothetical protein